MKYNKAETKLGVLAIALRLGDLKMLRNLIEENRDVIVRLGTDQQRASMAAIENECVQLASFERAYGPGSALKVENQNVRNLISRGHYTSDEAKNAAAAARFRVVEADLVA